MKKFIIVKDEKERFIMRYANIDFHKYMVCNGEKVFGGGMFEFSDDDTTMTLYGKSEDFGEPRWLEIKRWFELKKSNEKIHADEDLKGMKIKWLSGYDDNWNPIYLDFTDMFVFDYY